MMVGTLCLSVLASLAVLIQAVPETAILDESFTDVVELPSFKREEGERKYKLQAFGQEIDLDLQRTDDLLPTELPVHVYGEDEDGNPTVDDWTHRTDSFQQLYTDKKTGASLMVEEVDGETKLSGMLGDDLLIEPVTDVILPEDESVEKREITRLRHLVYKVKRQEEDATVDDFELLEEEEVDEDLTEKRASTLQRIYVPVQVIVDYSLWKKLARSESQVITYIKIFYNSVNMLYSSISYPTVSVSIYGIRICKTASACSMVENSRLGSDGVNAKTSLSDIAKYAYDERGSLGTDYALMIVMTDYDMCSPTSSGTCSRSTAGLAYVGTVCGKYQFSKTSKTGLAEDHGAFDGIKTVSHEMGHILGMKHDGDGPASTGAPGARSCSWTDHYIMGQTSFVVNQFKWSSCSVDQLRWTAAQSKASCLLEKPKTSRFSLINRLPGKEMSLDNQCKVLYGASSAVGCRLPGVNSGNDKICLGLMCKTSSQGCSSSTPAAEGSYCGPQRYCRQGRCVCDPSAPLPTPPPKDPSCTADNPRIRIGGKNCVDYLTSADGLKNCDSSSVKTYCCVSRNKYCRATPITCGKAPATPKPTPPKTRYTIASQTTRKPFKEPTDITCGRPCSDTPNLRISGQTCTNLLRTSSAKRSLCDNPTVIEHCCRTRVNVCNGYHSITPSCDSSCQDKPGSTINGKGCVDFLKTVQDRENYCDQSITKRTCCATRAKVCNNSAFGK